MKHMLKLKALTIVTIVYGCSLVFSGQVFGQFATPEYFDLVNTANSLYKKKAYAKAAMAFSKAFAAFGNKGSADDRFKAACAWAMTDKPDSSFYQLSKLADSGLFYDYERLVGEERLESLHDDLRWNSIVQKIHENRDNKPELNKSIAKELAQIAKKDSDMRNKVIKLEKKQGSESESVRNLWNEISRQDSIHLIRVKQIISEFGWLGPLEVGREGNAALFLVIQHSDTATQRKYLPILRQAVENHKAYASDLALLEDRVLIGFGKKQIYGSQLETDPATGELFVSPLQDPDGVDERRAKIGLMPMSEYLTFWNLDWDLEAYKAMLEIKERKK